MVTSDPPDGVPSEPGPGPGPNQGADGNGEDADNGDEAGANEASQETSTGNEAPGPVPGQTTSPRSPSARRPSRSQGQGDLPGEDGDPAGREAEARRQRFGDRVVDVFKDAALENEKRRTLYAALRLWPGLNLAALAEIIETSASNAAYHVNHLRVRGLVACRSQSGRNEVLCFCEEDADLWEDPRTRPLFHGGTLLQVAIYVVDHPRAKRWKIAEALDKPPSTIHPHLKTLLKHELVHRDPSGRSYIYVASDRLVEWVEAVGRRHREREEGDALELLDDYLHAEGWDRESDQAGEADEDEG